MGGDLRDHVVEMADVFSSLGGVVMLAPADQREAILCALRPFVLRGAVGPTLILLPNETPERRGARIAQAVDCLLEA